MLSQPSVDFVAAGGNRHPAAADWDSTSGILAFASDRNIALWKPLDVHRQGVRSLLSGHTDIVNVVKFVPSEHSLKRLFFSGSADRAVCAWVADSSDPSLAGHVGTFEGHRASINAIAISSNASLIATASADGLIKVWRLHADADKQEVQLQPLQDLLLKPHYLPLALELYSLVENGATVLAVGGTKSIVEIYVASGPHQPFSPAATLTGHEGWIRSLAFVREGNGPNSDVLLSSASQDKYIRLWRIHEGGNPPPTSNQDPVGGTQGSLSNKAHRFSANDCTYSVTFEALLLGHEDWIYTVRWSTDQGKLRLLSASADNTLAIWEPDATSHVWICTVRLGEINAQKGATTATGSSGGFWNGLWSPDGKALACIGRTGSWRMWKHCDDDDTYRQEVAVTGHSKEVRALAWARDGSYLLSTSADQTTRLFAEWKRDDTITWHEMSRPQVHGYDLNCIDVIDDASFISGADEKPLRVFEEPKAVAEMMFSLSGVQTRLESRLPDAASMPVMGLSNKAVEAGEGEGPAEMFTQTYDQKTNQSEHGRQRPPIEDELGRHLLWPEKEKLYGHGYEICAVASSHDGSLLATACRASSIEHAVIRGYKTSDWLEFRHALKAHSLTVTCLEFSADDAFLLSVGRDRQCFLFKRDATNKNHFAVSASDSKAHSRMVLDASWAPVSADAPRVFATAGRDKVVQIWKVAKAGSAIEKSGTLRMSHPVTAVAFAPSMVDGAFMLAVGGENGAISLFRVPADDLGTELLTHLGADIVPSRAVTCLAWRPRAVAGSSKLQLAAASEDSSIVLYGVNLQSAVGGASQSEMPASLTKL